MLIVKQDCHQVETSVSVILPIWLLDRHSILYAYQHYQEITPL